MVIVHTFTSGSPNALLFLKHKFGENDILEGICV